MKTQTIRLLDVFLIGPAMIIAGIRSKAKWLSNSMIIFGVATILYNGENYIKFKE